MNQQREQQINSAELHTLAVQIKNWAAELGFQSCGFTNTKLDFHEQQLQNWLSKHYHGKMDYMAAHGHKRSRPAELVPGTLRIISARMDYVPGDKTAEKQLQDPSKAYIARYALGRDYHKLMRKRLARLAQKIHSFTETEHQFRALVDSAPVLERAAAEKAGLGWIGKNTMLLNSKAGSWYFLGELYTDLELPIDDVTPSKHCGSCQACLDICPTQAFVAPYVLDARRCISYLTIESKDPIPLELRAAMGNRVFGCDDCQLVCPWNKFAQPTQESDFKPRHSLDNASLLELFLWPEDLFLRNTEGSAIRRIGYLRWQRNLAVGLGNAPFDPVTLQALQHRLTQLGEPQFTDLAEHINWAIEQQQWKKVVI